jgi:hypothetical protein
MSQAILERPGVKVFQELVSLTPTIIRPVLTPCIVGTSTQVEVGTAAGTYAGSLVTLAYPDLVQNATVDTTSVSVYLSNDDGIFDITNEAGVVISSSGVTIPAALTPSIDRIEDQIIATVLAGESLRDSGTDYFAADVLAGDTLNFVTNAGEAAALGVNVSINTGDFTVLAVVSQTEIQVTPDLVAETDVAYGIAKETSASGTILISYEAARIDGVGVLYEIDNSTDADTLLGLNVPENELRYGVGIGLQNTDRVVLATMAAADTVTAHQSAAEFLEAHEVYAIAPLTHNTAIHQIWKTHVDTMSLARNKKERTVIINREILDEIVYQTLSTTGDAGGVPTNKFEDSNALFITNEVPVGAYIELEGTPGSVLVGGLPTSTLRISQIISETEVRLVEDVDALVTGLSYTVTSGTLSKGQQARALQEYAVGFNDRRVVHVVPDTGEVSVSREDVTTGVTSSSSELVNAYFIACAIAAQTSAMPPAQGFTTLGISGFIGLRRSNNYFSDTQLGIIAAGGNWIMIQEVDGGLVQTRHQLTTAVNAIETREWSIVKAVDFSAKFLRDRLTPLIGRNNITDDFLNNIVRTTVSSILTDLIETGVAGSGTKLLRLEVSEDQPDTIEIAIDFAPLFPANYIEVTLEI